MANLIITEYADAGLYVTPERHGPLPIPVEPALADQAIVIGAEGDSAAFNAATQFVRLFPEADCHVKFSATLAAGGNPVATTSMQRLAAGGEYWRAVAPGTELSVIAAA